MSNKIRHSGVVDGIDGTSIIRVRILQSSACSACKVASHCNASETKEKLVEVTTSEPYLYHVGDSATVVADASVGLRASWYGYLLPLVLMVFALVCVLKTSGSEGMAALSSLGVLVPYYVCLYLLRGKLKSRLSFAIEKPTQVGR